MITEDAIATLAWVLGEALDPVRPARVE